MAFARSGLCRIGGSGNGGSTWQYTSTDAKTVVDRRGLFSCYQSLILVDDDYL